VTELQGAFQVAVISDGNKVKIQNVVVGAKQGAYWAVKSGVQNGDRVVTEGTDKMRDGVTVNPKPDPAIEPFVPDAGTGTPASAGAGSN
jgi:multidrug efflux pump subunit AcrA (membrane-fusion protein)